MFMCSAGVNKKCVETVLMMPNQVARLDVRNHVVHPSAAATASMLPAKTFSHFHSCFAKELSPFLPPKSCYLLEALSLLMRSRAEQQTANRSIEELGAFQRIAKQQ